MGERLFPAGKAPAAMASATSAPRPPGIRPKGGLPPDPLSSPTFASASPWPQTSAPARLAALPAIPTWLSERHF